MSIVRTNINDQAAALGAAALALVGCGLWEDFSAIDNLHQLKGINKPTTKETHEYNKLLEHYKFTADFLSDLGDQQAK